MGGNLGPNLEHERKVRYFHGIVSGINLGGCGEEDAENSINIEGYWQKDEKRADKEPRDRWLPDEGSTGRESRQGSSEERDEEEAGK